MAEYQAVAGGVTISITGDGAGFSSTIAGAERAINKLKGSAGQTGAELRRQMTEAKGSVEVLGEELGVHLPRHVQKFLAELPGVARAMSAAFSGVAIFAIGEAIYEAGKKLAEFAQKADEAAKKNAAAWASVHASISSQNDELDLTKIKLENAIAKLEQKPENKLLEAITEARVEADKLGDKMDSVVKQIQEAVKGEQSGFMSQTFLAQTGGTRTAKVVEDLQIKLANIDNGYVSGDPTQNRQAALQAASAALQKIVQDAHTTFQQLIASGTPTEHSSSRIEYEAASHANRSIQSLLAFTGNSQAVAGLQNAFDKLQEDATALTAAYEKQVEAGKKQMEAFEYQRRGSRPFEEVKRSSMAYSREANANIPESVTAADAALNKILEDQADDVLHAGERWAQFNRELAKGYEEFSLATSKFAELQAQIELSTGAISRHENAVKVAGLHSSQFSAQYGALGDQLTRINGDTSLTDVQRSTQSLAVRNQMDDLTSQRRLQELQDQATIRATSVLGELQISLQQTAQQFTDLGSILSGLVINSLNSFNETLIKVLSSHNRGDHAWSNLGGSVARDASGAALRYGEGSLMKVLFGKNPMAKLGTKDNPMWTKSADGAGGASGAGGVMGAVLSAFGIGSGSGPLGSQGNPMYVRNAGSGGGGGVFGGILSGGSDSDSGSGGGGVFGGILSTIFGGAKDSGGGPDSFGSMGFGDDSSMPDLGSIPGFANGGVIPGNMPSIVGENGPELFMPSTSGRIIPNGKAFAGGDSHTWNIDARGSSDPAQTVAMLDRYMRGAAPQIAAAANRASQERQLRRPRTA